MIDSIKKTLWAAADKLRANMDAAEYDTLLPRLISGQLRLPDSLDLEACTEV